MLLHECLIGLLNLGHLLDLLHFLILKQPLLLYSEILLLPELLLVLLLIFLLFDPELLFKFQKLPFDLFLSELAYLLNDPQPVLGLVYIILNAHLLPIWAAGDAGGARAIFRPY